MINSVAAALAPIKNNSAPEIKNPLPESFPFQPPTTNKNARELATEVIRANSFVDSRRYASRGISAPKRNEKPIIVAVFKGLSSFVS